MNEDRKPIALFFVLLFLLSVPFWILEAVHPIELMPGLPASALGAFIPALAALVLVFKTDRRAGVAQLLGRSFDYKRIQDLKWYILVIGLNPVIAVLAYWAMRAVNRPVPNPVPLTLSVVPMLAVFFVAALGEELGWSGYLMEPFQSRVGVLFGGILLGSVWAVWHFIPLMQAHRSFDWIAWWALGTVSSRVIMTWLYTYSGKSVFAAAIYHAMINLCWQLFPTRGSHYDPQFFALITLGLAAIIILVHSFLSKQKTPTV